MDKFEGIFNNEVIMQTTLDGMEMPQSCAKISCT